MGKQRSQKLRWVKRLHVSAPAAALPRVRLLPLDILFVIANCFLLCKPLLWALEKLQLEGLVVHKILENLQYYFPSLEKNLSWFKFSEIYASVLNKQKIKFLWEITKERTDEIASLYLIPFNLWIYYAGFHILVKCCFYKHRIYRKSVITRTGINNKDLL